MDDREVLASDLAPIRGEVLDAKRWAVRHLPPPVHVVKALQAQHDLWHRIKSDPFRPLTRDENRLDRRYQSVIDAHGAKVLDAYRNR